ncbi:hypothetical protein [Clostridium sp. Marseille-P2415]|uniref:hypothetical protein n=1 Tax=Clostridium sp. Marseille-P2415 TaxID=1805471 RepID=UPI0009882F74|nr:hypothetical protein [Clostridium sp. Marseille-P2415]
MDIKVQEQSSAAAAKGEPAAQDIQRAAEEAVLRGKLEADGRFIEELTQRTGEDEEERKQDSAREAGTERDTAALSDESRHYKLSPDELSDLDKMWGEKEADLAWQDILNWSSSPALPVKEELLNLAAVYDELLRQILINTTAGVREGQLDALNQILSDLLMEMLNTRLGELHSLFKSFGTADSMRSLQAALYRSVTGNSPDYKELEQVFKEPDGFGRESGAAGGPGGTGNIHVPVNDAESGSHQGIIYQPAGEGRIKNNIQYTARMQKEAAAALLEGKAGAYGADASISPMGKNPVYAPGDLEQAERFAGYMNHAGNLFAASGLSGGSAELYGFLAAVMTIKSQTYAAVSGMDKGLSSDLREAVDKMIDFYIQKAFRESGDNKRTGNHMRTFEPKAAYKIYYYMMNLYQSTSSLRETVNKGIRHAFQQYLKKKELIRDEEDRGFFFTKEKRDAIEDWKEGKRVLERDWKEFLDYLGREDLGAVPPGVLELSPWGMFAETEKPLTGGTVSPVLTFGALAVIFLLIIFISYMGI